MTNFQGFEQAFPGEQPVLLKTIAIGQGRPLRVLQRWAKQKRFRSWRAPEHPHPYYVPASEVKVIAALPRGSGNVRKPWKTRLAFLQRMTPAERRAYLERYHGQRREAILHAISQVES